MERLRARIPAYVLAQLRRLDEQLPPRGVYVHCREKCASARRCVRLQRVHSSGGSARSAAEALSGRHVSRRRMKRTTIAHVNSLRVSRLGSSLSQPCLRGRKQWILPNQCTLFYAVKRKRRKRGLSNVRCHNGLELTRLPLHGAVIIAGRDGCRYVTLCMVFFFTLLDI